MTLFDKGDVDEAFALCSNVLDEDPHNVRALFIVGHIFLRADKIGLARNIYEKVVELAPDKAEAWNNYARCFQDLSSSQEAMEVLKRGLEIDPDNAALLVNMALIYLNDYEPEKAIYYAERAATLDPMSMAARDNLSLAHLCLRHWETGFKHYQTSIGGPFRKDRAYCNPHEPHWDGEKDQTVVCFTEQGIGDEILFGTCLPELVRDSKKVIIDCDPKMTNVWKRTFPECDVYGTRYKDEVTWPNKYKIDCSVIIGDLPRIYRKKEEDFTVGAYLKTDPERSLQWKTLLDSISDKPKIGLAWNGGKPGTHSKYRSFDVTTYSPLLELDADFISLEYKTPDLKGLPIHHWDRATVTNDYEDTLALIENLDLVISVTTTAVHAAGALGIETWCLVNEKPNWRFPKTGGIPWHQSVEMIRQSPGESWENVIKTVKEKLNAYLHRDRSKTACRVQRRA